MNVENRQAHTLFGVVTLFFLGHALRIFLNLHEIGHEKLPVVDFDSPDYVYNPCVTHWPYWIMVIILCICLVLLYTIYYILYYTIVLFPSTYYMSR
jgi:hypothetical protein